LRLVASGWWLVDASGVDLCLHGGTIVVLAKRSQVMLLNGAQKDIGMRIAGAQWM
jgi:hypothetical protein